MPGELGEPGHPSTIELCIALKTDRTNALIEVVHKVSNSIQSIQGTSFPHSSMYPCTHMCCLVYRYGTHMSEEQVMNMSRCIRTRSGTSNPGLSTTATLLRLNDTWRRLADPYQHVCIPTQ